MDRVDVQRGFRVVSRLSVSIIDSIRMSSLYLENPIILETYTEVYQRIRGSSPINSPEAGIGPIFNSMNHFH